MFTFGLNPLLTKYSKFVVYASNSAPSPAPLLVWLGQQLFCIDTLQRNIHFRQGTCMRNHWCSHYRWHWSLCWQMLWSTIRWQWIHPQSRCLYWAVGGWVSYHACLDVWGLAWWHRAPFLVSLVAVGGLVLVCLWYFKFLGAVVLGGHLPLPDWLWDICTLCVHPGGGCLWGNPRWWPWVRKWWAGWKNFGGRTSRYWFWWYTHMRSQLFPLWGCIGNDSNWGWIIAGTFWWFCLFVCILIETRGWSL